MNVIDRLTKLLGELPGIGPRQARRFVFFLLRKNDQYIDQLISEINELRSSVRECTKCHRYFPVNGGGGTLCSVCSDDGRDAGTLMIVSQDVDLDNVEKSKTFPGLYFVLGGTLPVVEEKPERRIRINELRERVQNDAKNGTLKEIIVATSANPEGENTAQYVTGQLSPIASEHDVPISTLGRGLSTGTELEYSDEETLKSALENRK